NFWRHRFLRECPRAPAAPQELLNGMLIGSRVLHVCSFRRNHLWIISMSMEILISSPTSSSPLGSFPPHLTPTSCRLIFVVALAAARWFPQGSLMAAVGPSTSSTTDLVTP